MKKGFFLWALMLIVSLVTFPGLALADPTEAGTLILPLIGFGGLIVNRANLEAVFLNLKTTFNKAFDAAPSDWQMTTMLVPSGSAQNNYNWLNRFPKMREWIGDKVVKALSAFKYSIENKDWEATIAVDRNDIEDDTLGIYAPMAQEAGFSAKQLPDEIDAELKNNAFTNTCYDGQFFYDTDHPVINPATGQPASVSNKGVAALSNANLAAAQASLGAALTAIASFKDDEGRPLAIVGDTLEVGPALHAMANLLCNEDKLADNSPNPYKGLCKVKMNPRITSTTQWMVHCTTRPVKPFIFQERKKAVFVSQTDSQADDVFMRKEYKFGAEARAAGGYAFWQLSYGSTGAGA